MARTILHPITAQQVTVLQPKMIIVLLCYFAPAWLPTLLTQALLQWPLFATLASSHDAGYVVAFFFAQVGLIGGATVFVSRRYRPAIWTPQPPWGRGITISVLALLPLLAFHLLSSIQGILGAIALSSLGTEGRETLASVHHDAWARLAYGSSLAGIVCSSAMSFVGPVLEEVVFTGFVVNAIAKRCGFRVAVVGASACFTFVHAFQFGLGMHLMPLFFAGVTYASIRVFSGSLLLAIISHCTINAVTFLPKWVVAVIHFTQNEPPS